MPRLCRVRVYSFPFTQTQLQSSEVELYEYDLKDAEEVTSLCTARLDLRGNEKEYFAVGTMFYEDMENEPSRGRVLLFDVDGPESRSVPHLAAETKIKGCAYALMSQNGKLVAAVNTGVSLLLLFLVGLLGY